MPGVLPNGNSGMAMDAGINSAYSFAAMESAYEDGLTFLGFQQLSILSQRAEYRRPAEIIAREMTRKGWKLQVSGEDDKSKKIDAIEAEFDRLKLTHTIAKAVEQDGLFGRSQIFLDLGDDTASPDGRKELITPLKLDDRKLGKGAIKRLTVIEPLWTYPNDYNSNNPFDETFFKPQTWFVMGTEIHATRLLTIIGRPVSDLLKPAYAFGGLSLTQMAKPYVDNWLRTRQSVSDLLHSFSVMGLKTNLGEILNGGAAEMLRKRVQLFNQTRDNRGLMVLDKDTEELFNVSTSLGSLDHLQAQAQEHQSAVTGIPLSILLGITPSGLNASSEGEIRTFYAWVHAQQESVLGEPLNYILKAVQLSLFGEIDPEITLAFEPLWAMDDKELAEVRKTEADTDAIYLQQGVITQQESRARLAGQEDSPYMGLDLSVDLPDPQGSPADEGDPLDDAEGGDDDGGNDAKKKFAGDAEQPRGQPDNAGQFGPGGGASSAAKGAPSGGVALKGDELGSWASMKELRQKALSYAESFIGTTSTNADTGNEIKITRTGVKHTISGGQDTLIRTVPAIPDLLRAARKIDSEKDEDDDPNILAVETYSAPIGIDGKQYTAILTVKLYRDGHRYYDHGIVEEGKPPGV